MFAIQKDGEVEILNEGEAQAGRFFFVGLTSVTTYFVIFIALTEFAHLWYIMSSVAAFLGFLVVDFLGHKYITFRDGSQKRIHEQFIHFSLMAVGSWIIGTALLYIMVEYFHMWYLLAQGIITVIGAGITYFVMKLIFRRRRHRAGVKP